MGWSIKEAAERTGISVHTLRYYEKEGMVSPKRQENGYRYYDEQDIAILKNIVVMKYAHFTISEMKSMEEIYTREPSDACNEIGKRILGAKIVQLGRAIRNYQKIITLLEALLPMMESAGTYESNKEQINGFIDQIYQDVQRNPEMQ